MDIVKGVCPQTCLCPRKLLCLSCFNGGQLNPTTCSCTCPAGFTGERCQYAIDPCGVEDLPEYCSSISCWESASEDIFFRCQRKCLCCGNKKCHNLGRLTTKGADKCSCECASAAFDEASNCEKPSATCSEEEFPGCYAQFGGPSSCTDPFVYAICPDMCGFCDSKK
jgi:hypothetical protein